MPGLPFAGEACVTIVLPAEDPTLGGELPLLELERAGFEAELGAPVRFTTADPVVGPRWNLVLDPQREAPPATAWDPAERVITSCGSDVGGLFEALNLWRTVRRRGGGSVEARDCTDRGETIERVVREVADTYPAFALRGLDWPAICARHDDDVRQADDTLAALQRWIAELGDAHTWVWPRHGNLPCALRVADAAATFAHVAARTVAHAAGVRPAWRLTAVDDAPVDADAWLARTAAPPHSRPYLAGRRLLAGRIGEPRSLTAVGPDGREVTWQEEAAGRPPAPTVSWSQRAPGTGYLRVDAWLDGDGVDEAIDAALSELNRCEQLILDLRRNPGGNLVLASRTRDRFLRTDATLGSIRYSVGEGRLSPPIVLTAEPAPASKRWAGRLAVLTDELTFSSSEDFLLGLQGLEHVTVVGRPSGGGSGRPRSVRLLPGMRLTISTALTYDRNGRCVEGAGIPVDVPVVPEPSAEVDSILEAAKAL